MDLVLRWLSLARRVFRSKSAWRRGIPGGGGASSQGLGRRVDSMAGVGDLVEPGGQPSNTCPGWLTSGRTSLMAAPNSSE